MHWIVLLTLAVVIAVVAGVTGAKPSGTKPVSGTRLMNVARGLLIALAVVLFGFAVYSMLGP